MSGTTDFAKIYAERADDYDALVEAEDCEGNLARALESTGPLEGCRILDLGAGTGRVTRILLARGARVTAVDREPAMLAVARRRCDPAARCEFARANLARLPFRAGCFDRVVAGWALGHARYEGSDGWRDVVANALGEMLRVVVPGGTVAIVETLGTGVATPTPPAELAELYHWLQEAGDMRMRWFRTDYRFPDAETAARATGFFFGETFARRVREQGLARIPECTGMWIRHRAAAPSSTT